MSSVTIKEFYQDILGQSCPDIDLFLTENINNDIGHFNVFDISKIFRESKSKPEMPYNRRTYYKISLIKGQSKVEYADKTVEIKDCGILFASPKVPYNYNNQCVNQSGHFCVFTKDFLPTNKIGTEIDNFPVFSPRAILYFRFQQNNFISLKQFS